MSSGETRYLPQFPFPDHLERGRDNAVRCPVYYEGNLVRPSSEALTVYSAGGASVSTPAVAVVADIATATVPTADLSGESYGSGWRMEWALTISGVVHTIRQSALLVRTQLYPSIADPDLLHHHPDLKALRPSDRQSFQREIWESWATIVNRLIDVGNRPNLIGSPSSLRTCHKWAALAMVFEGMADGPGGLDESFQARADRYWKRYEHAWDKMTFEYCSDDGPVEEVGKRRSTVGTVALCDWKGV